MPVHAFDEQLHRLLAREAVPAVTAVPGTGATSVTAAVLAFGREVACRVGQSPWAARDGRTAALRALGWNEAAPRAPWQPTARVHDVKSAWIEGSAAPDDDRRNADRVLRNGDGSPLVATAGGAAIAIDPLIRQFGTATGLASQAHAHYALPPAMQVGTMAWAGNPARGAWDLTGLGDVHSESGEQAAIHIALGRRVAPSDATVAAYLFGAALHYLHDAADPMHNVHSGPRALLLNAAFGAYRGDQALTRAGVRILRNVHLAAETLQAAWFQGRGPENGRLKFAAAQRFASDVEFAAAAGPAGWVTSLANAGVADGLRIYRLMSDVMPDELRYGLRDMPDSVDAYRDWAQVLRDDPDPATLDELGVLLGRSIARARAVTRALAAAAPGEPAPADVAMAAARLQAQVDRVARLPYAVSEAEAGLDPSLCAAP